MSSPLVVRLYLFGAPSIRVIGGREAAAALAQPKRIALLAYLAAASPHGFHRRDSLLAMFWPEADREHARSALRKALHFLRREIAPGVIATRGDEMLGLGEDCVWCDVREFGRKLASGNLAEALTLYRADLLPGFFIPDAPEFERWIDDERLRLRGMAAEAAWSLAERLEGEGDADSAMRWAHWAAGLAPDDEPSARRLITLLARLGDRAGAIRAYDDLVAKLKREYEMAPSPETQKLLAAVRAGSLETGPARTAPPPAAAHVTSRQYVAVFPFPVYGDAAAAYLQEGLVDMLSTNLDHAGTLHAIDPHALLSLLGREGAERLDPRKAAELSGRFGAQFYVSGSVIGVAGQLRISAALHQQSPGEGSARFVTVAGPADRLFDLVDDLTAKLLAELHPGPAARLTRLAATTTASLPALKAYLAGERAMRTARYEEAVEAFEQALAHDPEFALASYRLAFFTAWPTLPQPSEPWGAMEHALRHKDRLSERDRMLLDALNASLRGRGSEAERRYRGILDLHPEDVEAWLGLGQTLVFHNQQRGRLISEARTPFERVLELDPGHTTANLFLCYIAELEGKLEESDRRIAASPGQTDFLYPRIVQAFHRREPAAREETMAFLRGAPNGMVYEAARFVATLTRDFTAAKRIIRLLWDPDRPPGWHGVAHILTAFLDMAAGRAGEARRELERAARFHPAAALEYRAVIAGLPFVPVEPTELEVLRDALTRWNAGEAAPSERPIPPIDLHRAAHPVLRLYLLGTLAARAGDQAALDFASELESVRDPELQALAHDLAHGVRAREAAERGDPAAALATLERARLESPCTFLVAQSPFYTFTAEHWLRAELLEILGRHDEALRWFASIVQSALYELIYLAPAHLHQGRIQERLGNAPAAAAHYRAVLELWSECDPELRPAVDEAAARLQHPAGRAGPDAPG